MQQLHFSNSISKYLDLRNCVSTQPTLFGHLQLEVQVPHFLFERVLSLLHGPSQCISALKRSGQYQLIFNPSIILYLQGPAYSLDMKRWEAGAWDAMSMGAKLEAF
jgi:hypothetical protein